MTYLISHSKTPDKYTAAYQKLFPEIQIIFPGRQFLLFAKIFIFKLKSTVFIENIHVGFIALLFRQDLKVVHVPRGGGTFKVGWRQSGLSVLQRLLVKLKLSRRDTLVVSSEIFAEYLAYAEWTPREKILIAREPLVKASLKKDPADMSGEKYVLIALSECADGCHYGSVRRHLPSDLPVRISCHPGSGLKSDDFEWSCVSGLITDCTTLSIVADYLDIPFYIISENQSFERRLFAPQNNFFQNVYSLSELNDAYISGFKSRHKFELTERTVDEFI